MNIDAKILLATIFLFVLAFGVWFAEGLK